MCGRFTLTIDRDTLQQAFPNFVAPEMHAPRYNIAPSQAVLAVPNDGTNTMTFFQWGLIPSWSKDTSIGYKMINARGETLAEKPSYRAAFLRRRCLILADGFYEWKKLNGGKQPMYIRLESGEPFAFAGLWEVWQSPEGDAIQSATIITTAPNTFMRSIHDRMPVILPRAAYDDWLDPSERKADTLQHLLVAYPAEEMMAYAVSKAVNSPGNDTPECVVPA